jgi:hypothetical protein
MRADLLYGVAFFSNSSFNLAWLFRMIKFAFITFVALAFQIIPAHWDFILGGIGLGALLVRNNILLMLSLGITFTTGLGAIVADHF